MFNTSERYHEYIRKNIMNTLLDVQYIKGISWCMRGEQLDSLQFLLKILMYSWYPPMYSSYLLMYWKSPDVLMLSPHMHHDIPPHASWYPPMYSWYPFLPDVLMVSLQCTEHPLMCSSYPPMSWRPPMYSWYSPNVLNTPPIYWTPPMYWTHIIHGDFMFVSSPQIFESFSCLIAIYAFLLSHNPLFFSLWKTWKKNIFGFYVVSPQKMWLFYMKWPSKHSCKYKGNYDHIFFGFVLLDERW